MEGTMYMRIVFLSYMKLYHCKISCTTSMTAGMATTVLDGSNNTDMTMRCWRHLRATDDVSNEKRSRQVSRPNCKDCVNILYKFFNNGDSSSICLGNANCSGTHN